MKTLLSAVLLSIFLMSSLISVAQIQIIDGIEKGTTDVIDDVKERKAAEKEQEEIDKQKDPVNMEAKIEVENVTTSFGLEESAGLKVNIVGASRKSLQKDWSRYIKKTTGVKKVEEDRTGEMIADMALIPGLESLPMSIFSIVKESSTGAEIYSSYKLDELFLSSDNEDKWAVLMTFIREYAVDYRKGIVEAELQDAQKILKKEQSNLKKLKDNNADLYQDIKDYEEKIKLAKEAIVQNEKDQKSSNLLLDKLMKAVRAVETRLGSIK